MQTTRAEAIVLFLFALLALKSIAANPDSLNDAYDAVGTETDLLNADVNALECDSGTIYNRCTVTSPKTIYQNTTIIQRGASLELTGSGSITCEAIDCLLDFAFSSITLAQGTFIKANGIFLDALNIVVNPRAMITTDGTSHMGIPPEPSVGASHAGFGGTCSLVSSSSFPYGFATGTCGPSEQGTIATTGDTIVRGGGYISIIASNGISIFGKISSDGESSLSSNTATGGGSGGCVRIIANQILGNGTVSAIGGDGSLPKIGLLDGGGGGSGGRIMVNKASKDGLVKFDVSGGISQCETKGSGAAGTLFTTSTKTLEVNNNERPNPTLTYYGEDATTVSSLVIKLGAKLASSIRDNQINTLNSIVISDFSEITGTDYVNLYSDSVTIRKSSSINCNTISIHGKIFTLDRSSSIEEKSVFIYASERVEISGYLRTETQFSIIPLQPYNLIVNITASGLLTSTSLKLNSSFIWVDGRLSNLGTFCPPTCDRNTSPKDYGMNFYAKYYIYVGKKGSIISGYMVMESKEVLNYGYISGSGTGCTSDNGPGKGSGDSQCAGGGGGHGGSGGFGMNVPDGPTNAGGNQYDFAENPICPGSGGGSTSKYSGGSGGGVLIIKASQRIVNDNFLISDGRPGATGDQPGGGGAGGSIQLHTPLIQGVGSITASGGPGASTNGGGGSGGRIRLYLVDESKNSLAKSNVEFDFPVERILVTGASGAGKGEDGSVLSSSCYPGYYGLFCLPCPVGTFKTVNGSEECIPCKNAPGNSKYIRTAVSLADCPYECDGGRKYPNCATLFDNFVDDAGGTIVLLVVLWTLFSAAFAYVSNYAHSKLSKPKNIITQWQTWQHIARAGNENWTDSSPTSKPQGQSTLKEESGGFVRYGEYDESLAEDKPMGPMDIKLHITRLYFRENNTYSAPWRLQTLENHELKGKRVINEDEYSRFTHLCNEHAAWRTWEGLVYFMLLICYPLANIFQSWRRRVHAKNLENFIKNYGSTFLRHNQSKAHLNPLKFGTNPDYSMAYIDILQHESSTSVEAGCPKFPMVLLICGNGSFLYPYQINMEDVYSASMFQKCEFDKWLNFVLELNNCLRCIEGELPHSVHPVLAYLAKQNDEFADQKMSFKLGRYLSKDSTITLALVVYKQENQENSVSVPLPFEPFSSTNHPHKVECRQPLTPEDAQPGILKGHVVNFFSKFTMKNRAPINHPFMGNIHVLFGFLFGLLIVDKVIVLFSMEEIFRLNESCFYTVLLVLPFALVVAPSSGFASIFSKTPFQIRQHVIWNTMSIVNILLCILYLLSSEEAHNTSFGLMFLLLFVKYLSCLVATEALAILERVSIIDPKVNTPLLP